MTTNSREGRNIRELTESQERILKQVWTYLLEFWGFPVDGEKHFDSKAATPLSSDKKKGKSSSFFGKKADGDCDNNEEDGSYKVDMIAGALKDVDPQDTMDEFWTMLRLDFPDNVLLRFLRARKWNTNNAAVMLAQSMNWRVKELQVDKILDGGEIAPFEKKKAGLIKNVQSQMTVIPCRDKGGRPVVWVRGRLNNPKQQTEDDIKHYAVFVIESARLFLTESADAASIFFDLEGFSMSNMDYAPVKFLITCFEAHYPESLGQLIIHKAPWFFQPIWNIVKKWLDPVVASKVVFTKNNKELLGYFDRVQLPRYCDGNNGFDFDHFDKPDPANDSKLRDTKTRDSIMQKRDELIGKFLQATINWIETDSREESKMFLKEKIELSEKISSNYHILDPYVRSRSQYDTRGLLKL